MPVKRDLWSILIVASGTPAFPKYPCPTCVDGRLQLKKGSYSLHESERSRQNKQHPDWEPEWTEERFVAFLECDDAKCGELVAMSGDTSVVGLDDEEDGYQLVTVLHPRSMTPPPPLFPVSSALPSEVGRELKLAFQFFWADQGACVSRLRTSLEALLDNKKIPHQGLSAKKKLKRYTLFERIDLFEQKFGDPDNAESMHALRTIGNLGTHGSQVAEDILFDAMDVYEDALLELYEGKTAKLKAKKLKLKNLK